MITTISFLYFFLFIFLAFILTLMEIRQQISKDEEKKMGPKPFSTAGFFWKLLSVCGGKLRYNIKSSSEGWFIMWE